uniref:Attacin C-terminal domain-containing protein n=1 Tax=Culex tarsalis TaxID=7177 RepID=B8RJ31_CULTA
MAKRFFLYLILFVLFLQCLCSPVFRENETGARVKRQFSLNFGATHQQDEGTDVTGEAIARLWRSQSGNTEVQGSASYNQHFGGFAGDGKARIGGMLTLTHNY